jgi:ankyrin repeat protein
VKKNDFESLKKLLLSDDLMKDINFRNKKGETPLTLAAENENLEIVQYLLSVSSKKMTIIDNQDSDGNTVCNNE